MKYIQLFLLLLLSISAIQASEKSSEEQLKKIASNKEEFEIFEDMVDKLKVTSKYFLAQILYYYIRYYNALENLDVIVETRPANLNLTPIIFKRKKIKSRKNLSVNNLIRQAHTELGDKNQIRLIKAALDLALTLSLVEVNPLAALKDFYNYVRANSPGEFKICNGYDKGKDLPNMIE